ncbi:Uncharacterised protein [Mycobacterium tuberculosis]|nr:Uncharacterised protein [Mycobacterium tuberculosis]
MPGRFREGTETCIRKVRTLETLPTCRQTQNPERGRKHFERELVHSPPFRSSDPKPREGTETRKRSTSLTILFSRRQTQNPERGRKRPVDGGCVVRASVVRPKTPRGDGNARNRPTWACPQRVVRPKTPRGDGNSKSSTTSAAAACSRSRQTQNPERGRKLNNTFFERGAVESVVRPKTPRGDGNLTARSFPASIR